MDEQSAEGAVVRKLEELRARYEAIGAEMNRPEVASNAARIVELTKEYGQLGRMMRPYDAYRKALEEVRQAEGILSEASAEEEMKALAAEEIAAARVRADGLLMELQKEFHLTYLFIAHDLRVVEYVSSRVAVMYLGKIMEMAGVEAIYGRPRHPYTEALLSAAPMPDPKAQKKRITLPGDVPSPINPPLGCVFHPRCRYRREDCERVVPSLQEIEPGHFLSCHHPINP